LTLSPLARDLRLKAERALATARELQDHDLDGSVNRSYYAMFSGCTMHFQRFTCLDGNQV
jgi:hypothetical protein